MVCAKLALPMAIIYTRNKGIRKTNNLLVRDSLISFISIYFIVKYHFLLFNLVYMRHRCLRYSIFLKHIEEMDGEWRGTAGQSQGLY